MRVDGYLEKGTAAGTGAEVIGIDDGPCDQTLQGGRVVFRYLCRYRRDSRGNYVAVQAPQSLGSEKHYACFQEALLSLMDVYAK